MAAYQYELLKCEDCGKTLGYIYISTKTNFYGLLTTPIWLTQRPPPTIKKTAFCESCFQKRLEETSKGKPEPKIEKAESVKPRTERKGRPLVR